MNPTHEQMELLKWRCAVLRGAGYEVTIKIKQDAMGKHTSVVLQRYTKRYHLADSINIINAQLGRMIQKVGSPLS